MAIDSPFIAIYKVHQLKKNSLVQVTSSSYKHFRNGIDSPSPHHPPRLCNEALFSLSYLQSSSPIINFLSNVDSFF